MIEVHKTPPVELIQRYLFINLFYHTTPDEIKRVLAENKLFGKSDMFLSWETEDGKETGLDFEWLLFEAPFVQLKNIASAILHDKEAMNSELKVALDLTREKEKEKEGESL
jgi:hypothetical protein